MSAKPWEMCRLCHRIGHVEARVFRSGRYCLGRVMTVARETCGQCGERRHLIECHQYDFRNKRRTPRRRVEGSK